jgi:hypothetical protein
MAKEQEPPSWDDRLAGIENDIKFIKEKLNILSDQFLGLADQEYQNSQAIVSILVPPQPPPLQPRFEAIPEPPKLPDAPKAKRGFFGMGAKDYSQS